MARTQRRRRAASATDRVQIGPYYLEWRAERADWNICWYDPKRRTRRRRNTGIGAGEPHDAGQPPEEARQALAKFYLESSKPAEAQEPEEAVVAELFTFWLREHVSTKEAGDRYAVSVKHWLRFFGVERQAGMLIASATVADVTHERIQRFIDWRRGDGISGRTISRDLAALRGALNLAWKRRLIKAAPFIQDVEDKAQPREIDYTPKQVAAILDAAASRPGERDHVLLYAMIALSSVGRSEAILELDASQIRDGLIYYLAPGEKQTRKRRAIVPVAPTLAPWLAGITGRVIMYRVATAPRRRKDAEAEFYEREVGDIGKAFAACLIEAGIYTQVGDVKKPIGTPNTLRHTAISWLHSQKVDERQIEMAAGHVPIGTNKRNYMHLRPDYLADVIDAIERFWGEVAKHTTVHIKGEA